MKKSIFSLIFVLSIVVSVFGGDLVFKVEKEVEATEENPAVIAEFDTAKYKTVRVGAAGRSAARFGGYVIVETIEGADAVRVGEIRISDLIKSGSVVVDAPGKRLRFSANTSGKYKVFVWSE